MSLINKKSLNVNPNRSKSYSISRLISMFFLLLSLLMFLYIFYIAEITFQGSMNLKFFKYYLFSLLSAVFWGGVLFLRVGIQANIIILATSLIISLYLIEIGILMFTARQLPNWRVQLAQDQGLEFDQRSKLQVIEDLIEKKVDAIPDSGGTSAGVIESDIDYLLPLGGISNKTIVGGNESGRRSIYISDRYGFNNPDSEWDNKNLEFLLTGDSMTQGASVQQGEDIASQIRLIENNGVINVGMGGNGPLSELAAIKEYAEAMHPKKVIWLYFEGNDLQHDLPIEKISPILIQYLDDDFSQNLINRQNEIDKKVGDHIISKMKVDKKHIIFSRWIRLKSVRKLMKIDLEGIRKNKENIVNKLITGMKSLARAGKLMQIDFDTIDVHIANNEIKAIENDLVMFARILKKSKSMVGEWGGELYFVYLPIYARYENKAILHDSFFNRIEVLDLVKRLDIKIIDIHKEVFENHSDPFSLFPLRRHGHYNAQGYSEVAKAIVTSVNKYEQSNK
jgi:hypothetical protein